MIQINHVSEGQSELRPLKHIEGAASQTRDLLRRKHRRPHRQLFRARGHLQGVTCIESRCNITTKHTVADLLGAITGPDSLPEAKQTPPLGKRITWIRPSNVPVRTTAAAFHLDHLSSCFNITTSAACQTECHPARSPPPCSVQAFVYLTRCSFDGCKLCGLSCFCHWRTFLQTH